jgi:hypothetical protein
MKLSLSPGCLWEETGDFGQGIITNVVINYAQAIVEFHSIRTYLAHMETAKIAEQIVQILSSSVQSL